jgi:hypothetical protein
VPGRDELAIALAMRRGEQVLAPGLTPKPEEAGVAKVLASPYTVPLD